MKSILDPSFRYVPSASTDLRKTFSRIRREMQRAGAQGVRPGEAQRAGALGARSDVLSDGRSDASIPSRVLAFSRAKEIGTPR